jgi:hypothetical protein
MISDARNFMAMKFSEFRNTVSRNLKSPPIVILQNILGKIPGEPVNVSRFYLVQFHNTPQRRSPPSRGRGHVRAARPEDAYEMGQFENKHEIFLRRFAAKEHGVVAIVDGKIVAYEWLSDKPFHIEERHLYKIDIPPNALYAYDAYILPEYRMSGIWFKLKLYSFDLMGKLGRDTVISFINQENRLSMNTHLRFGFVPFRRVYGARFFRKAIFREIAIQETGNVVSAPSPLNPRRSTGSPTTS